MDTESNNMTITDTAFQKAVLESTKPVLVEFSTNWCGASHMNAPILRQMEMRHKDEISFYRINIDEYRDAAKEYGIYQIPTILIFNRGRLVDHVVGAVPRKILVQKIIDLIRKHEDLNIIDKKVNLSGRNKMTFKNILVPIDFSEFSDKALDYAIALAQKYHSQLTLLHVIVLFQEDVAEEAHLNKLESIIKDQERQKSELMKKRISNGTSQGLTVNSKLARGFNAGDTILDLIEEGDFDLVVMGTHGRRGFNKLFFGSVAECVVRRSPVPVVTIHKDFNVMDIQKVLVPMDFSKHSKAAVDWGVVLAHEHKAELHFLHVVDMDLHPEYYLISYEPILKTNSALVDRLNNNLVEFTGMPKGKAVYALEEGKPQSEIKKYADENDIDLIVMAVRGMSNLEHLLVGSTAERIVRTAHCPVLTVGRNIRGGSKNE